MTGVTTAIASARSAPTRASACPSCGSARMEVFHEHERVPVHSCRLVPSRDEAIAFPLASLRLALCHDCGFITNVVYDPALQDYFVSYEETQGFSPRFRAFAADLAQRWVTAYDLHGKTVLEIGCGKAEFLAEMCRAGAGRGIGIDPAIVPERVPADVSLRLTPIRDLFDDRYLHLTADAVVCRHTLEHIAPVAQFMQLVRACAERNGAVVLFELPDVLRVLRETAFWDVYYEHCSYFSPGSLARLFRSAGFDVVDLALVYDDQYILIEAVPGSGQGSSHALEENPNDVSAAVDAFVSSYDRTIGEWRRRLTRGTRTVLWGGGSKAVAFLTSLGAGIEIDCVVDINPYKQGRFIAGTGHEVVAPAALKARPPDVVVVMNAVYLDEVRAELAALDISCQVVHA